jgi:tetratricopeptide (TPR) repeat protein
MEAQNKFEQLTGLLEFDTDNLELRRECVSAALQQGDFDAAMSLTDEGLRRTPKSDALLFDKANIFIGRGEFAAAIGILDRFRGLDPDNPGVLQNLALCNYCLGDFSKSHPDLEVLYAAGDRSAGVVRLLVSSCHHLGLLERAIAVADENQSLARLDSALAGVYALAYLDSSRAADAAQFAAISLRANPNGIDALTVKATLSLAAGDIDRARIEFEGILNRNPQVGRAWIGLGSMALLKKDFSQAKSDLVRGVEFMPAHVGSWHMLGWTHFALGELAEAEHIFRHALALDRNFAETHGALASIAAIRGDAVQAEEMIAIALRLDSRSLAARFAQSVLTSRSGDSAASQQLVAGALRILAGSDGGILERFFSIARGKPASRH